MLLSTRRERRIDAARGENAAKIGVLGVWLLNPDGGADSIAPLPSNRGRSRLGWTDIRRPIARRGVLRLARRASKRKFFSNTGSRGKL
jgi:hypothetical protein